MNIPAVGNYQEQQENADEIPRPNRQLPQAAPPVREIQRNQADNQAYEDEFDGRKEEEGLFNYLEFDSFKIMIFRR